MWLKEFFWPNHQRSIDALSTRLAELERRPVPDDLGTDVLFLENKLESLQGSLGALRGMFNDLKPQMAVSNTRLDAIETRIKELVHAIAEGIERTARAERRIGQTIARARAELKKRGYKDPGIEAEDRELRLIDADGSDESAVSPVPKDVGEPSPAPSSVSGVSQDQLRRARGY